MLGLHHLILSQVVFTHTHTHTTSDFIHSQFLSLPFCVLPVPLTRTVHRDLCVCMLRSPSYTLHAPQKVSASYTVALLKHAWPRSSAQMSILSFSVFLFVPVLTPESAQNANNARK